jgi:cytochrome c-type biogenesis protein CcmH
VRHVRLLLVALLLGAAPALAQQRGPALPPADPATEAREMKLAAELRCLVCQNQSIAESNADLALDLRRQIRELIAQGRSDAQIRDYMTARYGDFVLYRPPLRGTTLLLWFGPALLLAIGLLIALRVVRRRRVSSRDATPELSAEQHARAARLLGQADAPPAAGPPGAGGA